MKTRLILAIASFFASSTAWAAAGPDLAVTLTPPASVSVYQTAGYNVLVRNLGNKPATDVRLTIQLPLTATSPQVYVMGTLGAFSSSCSRVGNTLACSLGTIARNGSNSVFFDLALPLSTNPLAIDATATTAGETSAGNNSVHHVVNLQTVSVAMQPAPATNSHCTGSTTLSSYFECTLFPSSISSHTTAFNADGSITFVGVTGPYTGTWNQPAANRLHFEYFDGGLPAATFDGFGVSAKCFEGKTTFPTNPNYISLYRVCFP